MKKNEDAISESQILGISKLTVEELKKSINIEVTDDEANEVIEALYELSILAYYNN